METKNINLRGEETAVIFYTRQRRLEEQCCGINCQPRSENRNERNYERFKKVIKQIDLDKMNFCTYNNNKDEIYLYE